MNAHKLNLMPLKIDKSWTLFLDRDGVINERLPGDYVKTPEQFRFIKGSLEAIAICSKLFGRIIVVSNQQGIGKGLMTFDELELVHRKFIDEVNKAGGCIDKIYISPYLEAQHHFTRKPSVGMALMAKRDFNEISFRKAIIAGDSNSDMLFGKRIGMKTVYIGSHEETRHGFHLIDFCYSDLFTFAVSLTTTHCL